jgi:hypothetical protein
MIARFAKSGNKDIMFSRPIIAKNLIPACCAKKPPFHEELQKLLRVT